MFGIFMALFGGIGRLGYSVSQTLEDERKREEARAEGRPYYWSHDGQRKVSDNHKIVRGSYGIVDATTGKYIVDKRELERQMDKEYEEENRVSKQEAIIKGENVYRWKRRTGDRIIDWDSCRRLVRNDMPIERITTQQWDPKNKELTSSLRMKDDRWEFILYTENNFNFLCPVKFTDKELEKIQEGYYTTTYHAFSDKEWEDVVDMYKKRNIERIVHLINIYPINEIKWMHQYCFKYDIPMGTWEEVEQACWKEHPVKWGKPESSAWDFQRWFLNKYDY